MQEGVCWAILVALVSILLAIAGNGVILAAIARTLTEAIGKELAKTDDWRCRAPLPARPVDPPKEPAGPQSGPAGR